MFTEETNQSSRLNLNQLNYSQWQDITQNQSGAIIHASLYVLLFSIKFLLISFFSSANVNTYIAQLALSPFMVGYSLFYLHVVQGRQPERFMDLFIAFKSFKIYFKALAVYLLFNFFVIIGLILLIVPGCIAGFSLSQIYFIFAENPELSILQIFKRSNNMMKGRKMDFFMLMLSFTGWTILSILTFFVGFLWLIPYLMIAAAQFYIQVKSEKVQRMEEIDEQVSLKSDRKVDRY